MKIKKFTLAFIATFSVLVLFTVSEVQSNKDYPRAGNCGDTFTNKTCAQNGCHPSPTNNPSAGDVVISIGQTAQPTDTLTGTNTFKYQPGVQYYINFEITLVGPKFGFQTAILDAAAAQAGNFTTPLFNPATTKKVTSPATGTRQYLGHLNSSSNKKWTYFWTAPATNMGDLTMFYAYNMANNDNDEAGDVIYASSLVLQPEIGIGFNDPSVFSGLNITPNPATNNFNLSFNIEKGAKISTTLVSIDGKVISELMNEQLGAGAINRSFDVSDVPAGIYLVRISDGKNYITKKLLKQ
jgi:hypothetical protein